MLSAKMLNSLGLPVLCWIKVKEGYMFVILQILHAFNHFLVDYVPSLPYLLMVFLNHKEVLNITVFSLSIETITWSFFSFTLLAWCTRFIEQFYIPGMEEKSHLILVHYLFDLMMDLFVHVLLRTFAPMFIKGIGLWFSFFVIVSSSGFGSG
jgi:hypothetical protein